MEPRARAARHKSTLNFGEDLRQFLVAYGAPTHPDLVPSTTHPDSETYLSSNPTPNTTHRPTPYALPSNGFPNPYPETLRVLDEILTDFVIESCQTAVRHASLAHRQKIVAKDFDFVIRRDKMKLGRMQTMMRRQKVLKEERKIVDGNAEGGKGGKLDEGFMEGLAGLAGEEVGTGKGRGRGRGKRRKRGEMEEHQGLGGAVGKGKLKAMVGEDDLDEDADMDNDGDEDEPPAKRARSDTG